MRFSVWFAQLQQSKALIPIVSLLKKGALSIVRSPFKFIKFCLKFYFTLMLLLFCTITLFASFGAKATTVYDRASNAVNAGITQSCMDGDTPVLQVAQRGYPPWKEQKGQTLGALIDSREIPKFLWHGGCYVEFIRVHKALVPTDNGYIENGKYHTYTYKAEGTIVEAPECPPSSDNGSTQFIEHRVLGFLSDDTPQCFTVYDLTDASSCDLNNDVLGSASSPQNVCRTMDDGSKCAMEKYSVGGSYAYAQMIEPSTCFEGPISMNPYEEASDEPPTDEDNCYELGNGVSACPADPNDVCPNGQCDEGCGTFDIGGSPTFACISGNPDPEQPIDPIDPVQPVDITGEEYDTIRGTNSLLATQGAGITTLTLIGESTRGEQIKTRKGIDGLGTKLDKTNGLLEGIKDKLGEKEDTAFTPANFGDGQLYEPNDYDAKNYGTVLTSAVDEMKQSPIFESVSTFFAVSLSGSCPTYSTSVPFINVNLVIDQFCGPAMTSIWPIVRAIMLLVFSFLAFRVAVL